MNRPLGNLYYYYYFQGRAHREENNRFQSAPILPSSENSHVRRNALNAAIDLHDTAFSGIGIEFQIAMSLMKKNSLRM